MFTNETFVAILREIPGFLDIVVRYLYELAMHTLEINSHTKQKIMLNNDNDEARRMFEVCTLKSKHVLNPIIDWSHEEVWEYLNSREIPHCSLYDEGWARLGCISCPLSGEKGMMRDFARWPKYYDLYFHAVERMLLARKNAGLETTYWPNAQAVMDWWIHGKGHDSPEVPGQLSLFDSRLED
jgi:phosphoadenosine phosphosulfate reductase